MADGSESMLRDCDGACMTVKRCWIGCSSTHTRKAPSGITVVCPKLLEMDAQIEEFFLLEKRFKRQVSFANGTGIVR